MDYILSIDYVNGNTDGSSGELSDYDLNHSESGILLPEAACADLTASQTYSITILSVHPDETNPVPMAKVHGSEPVYVSGKKKIANYWHSYATIAVWNLDSIYEKWLKLIDNPYSALIRGELHPDVNPNKKLTRSLYAPDVKPSYLGNFCFRQQGIPLLWLDFDGVNLPDSIDMFSNTQAALDFVIGFLPQYLQNSSYIWHLSGSAGFKGSHSMRVHLVFWMDKPVHDTVLRYWVEEIINKNAKSADQVIDERLFHPIQYHFTSNPVFKNGIVDPFQVRFGLVKKPLATVPFPPVVIPEHYAKSKKSKKWTEDEQVAYSHEQVNYTGGDKYSALSKYNAALKNIGDHVGGKRFHKGILAAACSFIFSNGSSTFNREYLLQSLRERVKVADRSGHSPAEIDAYASAEYLDQRIDDACEYVAEEEAFKLWEQDQANLLPPHFDLSDEVSAAKAQQQVREAVLDHYENNDNIGLQADVGIGKSTSVVAFAVHPYNYGDKLALYSPSHKLNKELHTKLNFKWDPVTQTHAKKHGNKNLVEVTVIRGRNYQEEGQEPMCHYAGFAAEISRKGWSPASLLCLTKVPDKQAGLDENGMQIMTTKSCGFFGTCEYIGQYKAQSDIRIYPHKSLASERGMFDKFEPTRVAIDESFFKHMLVGADKPKTVTFDEIKKSGWSEKLIQALVTANVGTPLLQYFRQQIGCDYVSVIEDAIKITKENQKPFPVLAYTLVQMEANLKSLPKKNNLSTLLEKLFVEIQFCRANSHALSVWEGGYNLYYRIDFDRLKGEDRELPPILMIDADLNPLIVKKFLPDFKHVVVKVKKNCFTTQCYSHTNSNSSMLSETFGEQYINDFKNHIDMIDEGDMVLIGPQKIVGNEDKKTNNSEDEVEYKAKFKVKDGSAILHYGGYRGVDKHKDKAKVYMLSRNQPSISDIEATARALFWDDEEELQLNVPEYGFEYRVATTVTGYKKAVKVRVHPDKRCQTVLEQLRECEAVQGIGRIRPVWCDDPKEAYIASNLVLPWKIHHLLDHQDFVNNSTLLTEAFKLADGLLMLGEKAIVKQVPTVFPTAASAKTYFRKVGVNKPALLNALLVTDFMDVKLYEYSLMGNNGTGLKCLSKYSSEESSKRLIALCGQGIKSIKEIL